MCQPLVEMRRRDDRRNTRIERKLQDHAPHRGRRRLHRIHQTRRSLMEQDAYHQERKVDDVDGECVERIGARAK
jgi:hypothetical protein